MSGKGSKRRKENIKAIHANWDEIDWGKSTNLSLDSLKVGENYRIDWECPSGIDYYHGFGILAEKHPRGYPHGTLRFILEHGESGFFDLNNISIINTKNGAFSY